MPLEQEVKGILIVGFLIVMIIAIIFTLFFAIKNKQSITGYAWIFLYFIFFTVAILFGYNAISFDYNHPMASEEISLQIGFAGVAWSISMFCLVMGIYIFSRKSLI
ncbi:hypothetical protein SAMN05518871_102132 [Psychrobacillus sp. OK028]|uniref:hypothetical protein n=1 Tax=Psychrobacillus sp. OK028 TaxID=1884359 RepID=UPI0008837836|nr:hypothetical protein [Psychrobacillus sp. OK028]SDM74179.1 hypothetical protein SAMN05518871_102132 [Psychrobacillus sp. OK028]